MKIEKYPCMNLSQLPSELGQAVIRPSGEPTFKGGHPLLLGWDRHLADFRRNRNRLVRAEPKARSSERKWSGMR